MLQNAEFRLLTRFFDKKSLRFTEICNEVGLPTDLGGYYIRQLIAGGFLEKSERGVYTITLKGLQQLASSYGLSSFVNRPRLCVMVVAEQNGKYLVLERTRQPFIGVREWPAGSVILGEQMLAAAKRILADRSGVAATPEFYGFFRRIDMYKNTPFDDKLFAIHTYKATNDVTFSSGGQTGNNALCTPDELRKSAHPSKSLLDIFNFVTSGEDGFEERIYALEPDDLFITKTT